MGNRDEDGNHTPSNFNKYDKDSYEPRYRLPTYNGEQDFLESFLWQFQRFSQCHAWTDEQYRLHLILALKGDAVKFASTLSPDTRGDTKKLTEALKAHFGQSAVPELHRINLYNIEKDPCETLQKHSARVNRLMTRAYPGMSGIPIFEQLAVEHFLRGLPDKRLAYDVLTKKPRDIYHAVEMITWFETCKKNTTHFIDRGGHDEYQEKKSTSVPTENVLSTFCKDLSGAISTNDGSENYQTVCSSTQRVKYRSPSNKTRDKQRRQLKEKTL